MGDISQLLGQSETLDYEGHSYHLAPAVRYDVQGLYVRWLKQNAWQAAREAADYLDHAEYERVLAATGRDIASKQYDFGGETCLRSMQSVPGQKHMLWLLMQAGKKDNDPETPEPTHELVDQIYDKARREVELVLSGGASADPNATAPATAGAKPSLSQPSAPS